MKIVLLPQGDLAPHAPAGTPAASRTDRAAGPAFVVEADVPRPGHPDDELTDSEWSAFAGLG